MTNWWDEERYGGSGVSAPAPQRAPQRPVTPTPAVPFSPFPQQGGGGGYVPFFQQSIVTPWQNAEPITPLSPQWGGGPLVQKWSRSPQFDATVQFLARRNGVGQNMVSGGGAAGGGDDGGGSFWGDVLGFAGDVGGGILQVLDTPRSVVASTAKELTDLVQGEGFSFTDWADQVGNQIGWGEVVEDWGIENIWMRRALGFVGDVFLDPVNYTPAMIMARGAQAGRYLPEVASLATRLRAMKAGGAQIDDALIEGIERVGVKFAHNRGASLTASEISMVNATRGALGMSQGVAALGDTSTLLGMAGRAARSQLDGTTARALNQATEEGYKSGVRLIVPGTGRLARTVTGRATEKTVQIAPQALQRFTPSGIFQGSAAFLRKGNVSNRTIRKALGGDYTEVKSMIASNDPKLVMEGVATQAALNMGRNSRQAFNDDIARLTRQLRDQLDPADGRHVMGALQGNAEDIAALGPEKMALVDNFRNQWREAINTHVRPNDLNGVTDEELLAILQGDLVGDLETWSPLAFREDAKRYLDGLSEEQSARLFDGPGDTVNPRNAPAKIKDGETFMGEVLVKASDDALGRTPVQQANDIFAARLAEQGVGSIDGLFEDDFFRAVHIHALWQSENIARERAVRELAARGVGVRYTPYENFAVARAMDADGRRKLDSVKAAQKAQAKRMERAEKLRGKAQAAGASAQERLDAVNAERARTVAQLEARLDAADKAGERLWQATQWRETAEGIEAAARIAVNRTEQVLETLRLQTQERIAQAAERATAAGRVAGRRVAVDAAADASATAAARRKYQADLKFARESVERAQKQLDEVIEYNDAVFGEMDRVRRRFEEAVLEAEHARKMAARDVKNAKAWGRRLSEAELAVDRASAEVTKWEEGLGIFRSADEVLAAVRAQDEIAERLARFVEEERVLRKQMADYQRAVTTHRDGRGNALAIDILSKSGYRSFEDGVARLRKLQNEIIPQWTEGHRQLKQQLDVVLEPYSRRGIETSAAFKDLKGVVEMSDEARAVAAQVLEDLNNQARRSRVNLAQAENVRDSVLGQIDALPEPARRLAALESIPRPLTNGRLGNRAGDVWTPSATAGGEPTRAARFYGNVLSEGIGQSAEPRQLLARNPIQYVAGEQALDYDAFDALLRTQGFKPPKSWGGRWQRVQARMVKKNETLEQAVLRVFGRNVDARKVVADLVESTDMPTGVRRQMARAHREWAISTGHDAITFVDRDGRWHAIPLDRNSIEGLTTDLPEEGLEAVIKIQNELVDRLYEGARAKQLLADELGADLEVLNGRLWQAFPDGIPKLDAQLAARRDELDRLIALGEPEAVTAASDLGARVSREKVQAAVNQVAAAAEEGRRASRKHANRLVFERGKLQYAEDLGARRREIEDARQAVFDGTIEAVDEEVLNVAEKIVELEQGAALAEAQLARAGKNEMSIDTLIEKLKKVDQDDLDNALRAGWKGVGVGNGIQIPPHVYEALNSASKLQQPGGLIGFLDEATKVWKAMAVASPGFHSRNFVGGLINAFSYGIDHGRYRQFFKADRAYRKALRDGKSIPEALDAVRQKYGQIGDAYAQVRRSGITQGGQFDELDFIDSGNRSLLPWRPNFVVYRAGRQAGESVEEVLRGAMAMDVILKGGNMDAAINTVHKFHFDYEDLSSFERNWARRIMPFYTWTRKNLPLQLEMLADSPKTFTRFLAVQRNLEIGTEEEEVFPHYLDRLNSIRLPWKFGGDQMYLTPQLPFNDMTQMTDWRKLMSSTNPLLRTPLELAADQSFFTGVPFQERMEKMPKSWEWMAPAFEALGAAAKDDRGNWMISLQAQHVINQVPFLALANRVDPSGPRENNRIATSLASFGLGLGLRVNAPRDQLNELWRRAFQYDGEIQRARELGQTARVEELQREKQMAMDAAIQMRDQYGLGGG